MLKSIACFSGALSIAMLAAGNVNAQEVPSAQAITANANAIVTDVLTSVGILAPGKASAPAAIAATGVTSKETVTVTKSLNGTTEKTVTTSSSTGTPIAPQMMLPTSLFAD
jgi:hypothetical protein